VTQGLLQECWVEARVAFNENGHSTGAHKIEQRFSGAWVSWDEKKDQHEQSSLWLTLTKG